MDAYIIYGLILWGGIIYYLYLALVDYQLETGEEK